MLRKHPPQSLIITQCIVFSHCTDEKCSPHWDKNSAFNNKLGIGRNHGNTTGYRELPAGADSNTMAFTQSTLVIIGVMAGVAVCHACLAVGCYMKKRRKHDRYAYIKGQQQCHLKTVVKNSSPGNKTTGAATLTMSKVNRMKNELKSSTDHYQNDSRRGNNKRDAAEPRYVPLPSVAERNGPGGDSKDRVVASSSADHHEGTTP